LPELGEALGIGMQINNDVYDLYNSLEQTGKDAIGEDITNGKKTLMVIHSIYKGKSKAKVERLKELISLKTKDPLLINEAINIMQENGSIDYASK